MGWAGSGSNVPALLIKTSKWPNLAFTMEAALDMDASEVTSISMGSTEQPSFCKSATAASPRAAERAPIRTWKFSCWVVNCLAIS